jgi:parallel beta-helix repeat protein
MSASRSIKLALAIFIILSLGLVSIGDSTLVIFHTPPGIESEDRASDPLYNTRGSRAFIKKTGDWVVTGNEQFNGDTIHLTGNLYIATTGSLSLINARLIMNCSTDGEYMVQVNGTLMGSKGTLIGFRTIFRSANPRYTYKFKINGTAGLSGCTVRDLWGVGILEVEPTKAEVGGIEIRSNNVIIKGCLIRDFKGYAICCMGSEPKIHSNKIEGNISRIYQIAGIYCAPLLIIPQNPEIIGNNITNCSSGIRADVDDPIVRYNNISTRNGYNIVGMIVTLLANPTIEENNFMNNLIGVVYLQGSGTLADNDISGNGLGVWCTMGSAPDISGNTIENNLAGGINLSASSPDITGNDIIDNGLVGIGVDGASPLIERNNIVAPQYMTGILCLNGSSPDIIDNDIVTGDSTDGSNGAGISCNESSTPTISYNEFTIYADGIGVSSSGASPSIKFNDFMVQDNSYGVYVESDSSANIEDNNFYGVPFSMQARADSKYAVYFDENMPVYVSKANNNTVMNFSTGIRCYDCSGIEVVNNFISNVKNYAVHVEDSDDVLITQPDLANDIVMVENSTMINVNLVNAKATSLNSSIYQWSIDNESQLTVTWYLHLKVTDTTGAPVDNASVKLINITNIMKHDYQTPANGLLKWIRVIQYIIEDRDEDGTVEIYPESPWTLQVGKYGYHLETETLDMFQSKTMTVVLGPNSAPGMPTDLWPKSTHNLTPQVKWSPSIDSDGDILNYHVSVWEGNSSAGTLVVDDFITQELYYNFTTNLSYGPGNNTYYLEIHADDGWGGVSGTVGHEFYIVNNPPEIGNLNDITVLAGELIWFTVTATDPDIDPVDVLTFGENSAKFEINSSSGEVYWIPQVADIGVYEIEFTVEDGVGGVASRTINISVLSPNLAPVPDAGKDWTVQVNTTVTLNGSGSYDPDGNITGYEWDCVTVNVTFTNANSSKPSFIPTVEGVYRIRLRVLDNNLTWSPFWDEVNITVLQPMEPPNTAPELKNGQVQPSSGDEKDNYTFTIEYYDENNDPPGYVQVIIDDTIYTMIPVNTNDTDYRNGTDYYITIDGYILGAGNITYRFEASDGTDLATGDIGNHSDLTIEPYKKKDDKDDDDDDLISDFELYSTMCWLVLLVVIIIIIVIIVAVVLLFKKRRREPRYYDQEPYEEEPYYEDQYDYYEEDEMYEEPPPSRDRRRAFREDRYEDRRKTPPSKRRGARDRRREPAGRAGAGPAEIDWDEDQYLEEESEYEYEDEYDEDYEDEDEYENEDYEKELNSTRVRTKLVLEEMDWDGEESEDEEGEWAEGKEDEEADWDEDEEDEWEE